MAHNHLEQLIAEWYEYKGYFVRRNVHVGRRSNGGWECELDIVALHPGKPDKGIKPHLVHLEPSLDSDKWEERERRFRKKFDAGKKYIKTELFPHFPVPEEIEQFAVLVYASDINHPNLGGGKVLMVSQLIEDIFSELKDKRLESKAIPEQWMILRSFQYVSQYRNNILKAWSSTNSYDILKGHNGS